MPLSNEQIFGVVPMTQAINSLPRNPTIIRELGIFKNVPISTTYVSIEHKEGVLSLVEAKARGSRGEGVQQRRYAPKNFNLLHLPVDEAVFADELQNLRAFGSDNKTDPVANKVLDKADIMKQDLEYTHEHLMLGAIQGKIINSTGETLLDLNKEYGLTRTSYDISLSSDNANINKELSDVVIAQRKHLGGEMNNGWLALCGKDFFQNLIYHNSIKEVYLRYQEALRYRDEGITIEFEHQGIRYKLYDYEFDGGTKVADDQAELLPFGTKNTFANYIGPADMNQTVNTLGQLFYLSREPMPHQKGWDLHAQSNILPLVHRPKALATLKMV